jgi:hypothetical protein
VVVRKRPVWGASRCVRSPPVSSSGGSASGSKSGFAYYVAPDGDGGSPRPASGPVLILDIVESAMRGVIGLEGTWNVTINRIDNQTFIDDGILDSGSPHRH